MFTLQSPAASIGNMPEQAARTYYLHDNKRVRDEESGEHRAPTHTPPHSLSLPLCLSTLIAVRLWTRWLEEDVKRSFGFTWMDASEFVNTTKRRCHVEVKNVYVTPALWCKDCHNEKKSHVCFVPETRQLD